jgi:hypothetical protein
VLQIWREAENNHVQRTAFRRQFLAVFRDLVEQIVAENDKKIARDPGRFFCHNTAILAADFLVRKEAGDGRAANRAFTLGHMPAALCFFYGRIFDRAFFATLYTVTFKIHFSFLLPWSGEWWQYSIINP